MQFPSMKRLHTPFQFAKLVYLCKICHSLPRFNINLTITPNPHPKNPFTKEIPCCERLLRQGIPLCVYMLWKGYFLMNFTVVVPVAVVAFAT